MTVLNKQGIIMKSYVNPQKPASDTKCLQMPVIMTPSVEHKYLNDYTSEVAKEQAIMNGTPSPEKSVRVVT
jgi:hypothetical protein